MGTNAWILMPQYDGRLTVLKPIAYSESTEMHSIAAGICVWFLKWEMMIMRCQVCLKQGACTEGENLTVANAAS